MKWLSPTDSYLHLKKLFKDTLFIRTFQRNKVAMFTNPDLMDGFSGYLKEIEANGYFDSHNWPQTHFLAMPYDRKTDRKARSVEDVDCFLSFENLNSDLSRMTGKKIILKARNFSDEELKQRLNSHRLTFQKKIDHLYAEDYRLIETRLTYAKYHIL